MWSHLLKHLPKEKLFNRPNPWSLRSMLEGSLGRDSEKCLSTIICHIPSPTSDSIALTLIKRRTCMRIPFILSSSIWSPVNLHLPKRLHTSSYTWLSRYKCARSYRNIYRQSASLSARKRKNAALSAPTEIPPASRNAAVHDVIFPLLWLVAQ